MGQDEGPLQQQPPPPVKQPLFRFGLVTDVQYADKDSVLFEGRLKRYRESRGKLAAALEAFAAPAPGAAGRGVDFVLTAGDIIDGYGPATELDPEAPARAVRDLREIAGMFAAALPAGAPALHALGNHCLAAPRDVLLEELRMPASYYSRVVAPGWRVVVLDTTDMSLHSCYPEDSEQMCEAREWLERHPIEQHPNAEPWNGGLSRRQMAWLRGELGAAVAAGQRVIAAAHHPLAPGSAAANHLAWGHEEILQALEERPGLVALAVSGHFHPGGYARRGGTHYVVFEGVLEAPPDSCAHAVVEVFADRISIRASGVGTSRELELEPLGGVAAPAAREEEAAEGARVPPPAAVKVPALA